MEVASHVSHKFSYIYYVWLIFKFKVASQFYRSSLLLMRERQNSWLTAVPPSSPTQLWWVSLEFLVLESTVPHT